jgi:histidinol-phosphate/aromatic aminotransferase/cobyric acid decarboxylase-like protein
MISARARAFAAQETAVAAGVGEVPSPVVRAAVEQAMARGETHYTDRPGILPLRELVAERITERFGMAVNGAEVLITCGVEEARFVACQQLLRSGGLAAGPADTERITGAVLLRGARLGSQDEREDLLYLASSLGEPPVREALARCPDQAAVLYEVDEPHGRFHPAQVESFAARTTTIGPLGASSWRVGYLVSPPTVSPAMRDFKQALTICSTNLSQWAMLAALRAGEVQI